MRFSGEKGNVGKHTRGHVAGRWGRDKPLCVYAKDVSYRESMQAHAHKAGIGSFLCLSRDSFFARTMQIMQHWKLKPFCPCFMTHEFKQAEFHATCCDDKIKIILQHNVFCKNGHVNTATCTHSVSATCPLVCADLKGTSWVTRRISSKKLRDPGCRGIWQSVFQPQAQKEWNPSKKINMSLLKKKKNWKKNQIQSCTENDIRRNPRGQISKIGKWGKMVWAFLISF